MGAKVLRYYASPAAGNFASVFCKERKKGNMNKKKMIKSIAAAGIAIGGASVFQDGELVYAMENEQQDELLDG